MLVLRRKDGHVLVGRLLTLVEVAAKGVNVKGMHDVKDIKRSPVIMKRERQGKD